MPASGQPALSFVIPLYNSAGTIQPLVRQIAALRIEGGHEIVLVNDGSSDGTWAACGELLGEVAVPITLVDHARNFGEHNAVLTGYRHARGAYVVNLDDDGQNPPAEAVRLWEHARHEGLDVVFGHYATKEHSPWRNFGSWLTNRMADWMLDKPRGLYLSSFRCVSALAARAAAEHTGPYPYIDGLLLQVTQRIGALEVSHEARHAGHSGYTLRRLLRLWLSTFVNFSVMPLRLATVLGLIMAALGLADEVNGHADISFLHPCDVAPYLADESARSRRRGSQTRRVRPSGPSGIQHQTKSTCERTIAAKAKQA